MDVTIEAIKFNHDRNSTKADALTIRKNQDEDITGPEWERVEGGKPRISAVAYARTQGNALTIAVQLRRFNMNVQSVEVSAVSKSFLGNVASGTIKFREDNEVSDFEVLKLTNAKISSVNVTRSNVSLTWTLKASGAAFNEKTTHLIYTLLDLPRPPWGPHDSPDDYEVPWADVIDRACRWAPEAKDCIEVASRITEEIHKLGKDGKLKYAQNGAHSCLAINGTKEFDCTKFLNHLKGSAKPLRVNCTDCAILVSTFANILGCNLFQSLMGYRFGTNPIRMIGFDNEEPRIPEYHEVAWELPCDSSARLFDCCLQVDGDSDPSGGDFKALLPISIPFGQAGTNYHFRLVKKNSGCQAFPGQKIRRRIVRKKILVRSIDPELEKILKEEFDFSSWKEVPSSHGPFLGLIEDLTKNFLPDGWKLNQLRILKGEVDKVDMTEAFWQSTEPGNRTLRVLTYRWDSVSSARAFLLNLLGDFEMPVIRRRRLIDEDSKLIAPGELAFSDSKDFVFLLARSNLVVFTQNAGSTETSVLSFARAFDDRIRKALEGSEATVQLISERAENQRLTMQGLNSTSTKEKENKLMFIDLEDSEWTSNRPLPSDYSPNPMKPDGKFTFENYDPISGKVDGTYLDLEKYKSGKFQGWVKYSGNDSYIFVLYHDALGYPFKRLYEGETIVDSGKAVVVTGRWVHLPHDGKSKDIELIDFTGQEEGVWVATKP